MKYSWYVAKETVPNYLKINKVENSIAKAMEYVSQICKNQVEFSKNENGNIVFGFEDFGENELAVGSWELAKPNKYVVAFNSQYKWGTLYQFWRPMSIKMITIHELGHILGLHVHSDDPHSVMNKKPYLPYFSSNDKAQLLYLTNPNRQKTNSLK